MDFDNYRLELHENNLFELIYLWITLPVFKTDSNTKIIVLLFLFISIIIYIFRFKKLIISANLKIEKNRWVFKKVREYEYNEIGSVYIWESPVMKFSSTIEFRNVDEKRIIKMVVSRSDIKNLVQFFSDRKIKVETNYKS